ncbi:MAG: TraB/GumN family protein [Candidatus Nanoarchaeia archaeon]
MVNLDALEIIGTSHVSKESKEKINETFERFKPDIICIELDAGRYYSLMHPDKKGRPSVRQLGMTGFLFAVIGRFFQKKLGNMTGMNPGEEMLLGANLAKKHRLKLELIDQDAAITLRNLSKKVKLREKLKILLDLFRAPFIKDFRVKIDVSRIPDEETINKIMNIMKKRYSGFYRVLLEDRNRYMAKKLYLLLKDNPEKRIIAIVGAGHVEGIKKQLKTLNESNIY